MFELLRSGARRDGLFDGRESFEGDEVGESTRGIGLGEGKLCSVDRSRRSTNGPIISVVLNLKYVV